MRSSSRASSVDRGRVVVHPQVDRDVVARAVPGVLADDEQGRGLAPALVAAGLVAGPQRLEQAPLDRPPGGALPGELHGLDDLGPGEDVALDGVAGAGHAAGPVVALGAGVRRRVALGVDDARLAVLGLVVLLDEARQRHLGGGPVVEVGQGEELPRHVGLGLGRDGAHPGDRGGDGGADGEELGGDGHAPRLAVVGPGHDREGHGPTLVGGGTDTMAPMTTPAPHEPRPIETWLTDMDGVLVHEEHAIPGAADFVDALKASGPPLPGAHQQLDLHPARPARPAARQRHRRAGGRRSGPRRWPPRSSWPTSGRRARRTSSARRG